MALDQRWVGVLIEAIIGGAITAILAGIGFLITNAYQKLSSSIDRLTEVLGEIATRQGVTETRIDEHAHEIGWLKTEVAKVNQRCFDLHVDQTRS